MFKNICKTNTAGK